MHNGDLPFSGKESTIIREKQRAFLGGHTRRTAHRYADYYGLRKSARVDQTIVETDERDSEIRCGAQQEEVRQIVGLLPPYCY